MNEVLKVTGDWRLAAQQAARLCESQQLPKPSLYMVASPIGNLGDLSARALQVLALADLVACEDTRHSHTLLHAYGLNKPATAWLAVHEHNELSAAQQVIVRLQAGQRVAYLCDAGTPGISDPGARLVAAVAAAGFRVVPIPGPSSVTALLSAAGADLSAGWLFQGFLPAKGQARQQALNALALESRAQVLLESPHRIQALLVSLAELGERRLTIGRELTKQFEDVHTLTAQSAPVWLQAHAHRTKGEFTLLLHAQAPVRDSDAQWAQAQQVMAHLLKELPLGQAARLAAQISQVGRKALYDWGLSQKP